MNDTIIDLLWLLSIPLRIIAVMRIYLAGRWLMVPLAIWLLLTASFSATGLWVKYFLDPPSLTALWHQGAHFWVACWTIVAGYVVYDMTQSFKIKGFSLVVSIAIAGFAATIISYLTEIPESFWPPALHTRLWLMRSATLGYWVLLVLLGVACGAFRRGVEVPRNTLRHYFGLLLVLYGNIFVGQAIGTSHGSQWMIWLGKYGQQLLTMVGYWQWCCIDEVGEREQAVQSRLFEDCLRIRDIIRSFTYRKMAGTEGETMGLPGERPVWIDVTEPSEPQGHR